MLYPSGGSDANVIMSRRSWCGYVLCDLRVLLEAIGIRDWDCLVAWHGKLNLDSCCMAALLQAIIALLVLLLCVAICGEVCW
jgi:hypothetical protein